MKASSLSRRNFLKTSVSAGAVVALGSGAGHLWGADEVPPKKIPVGLQLYSVRSDCAKDLPGTIRAIGKMGYKAVEFAGYYGRDAKTLRQDPDEADLKCCGTHIGLETLLGDNLARTIEFNEILRNEFLIVPSLPEARRNSKQAWIETAGLFNDLSEKVKPHGMRVGYHNHTVEFQPLEGGTPWDFFFDHTNKDVAIQFDTGNAMEGGADPMVYLPKHPGRVASLHVKAFSKTHPDAIIGEDELPWKDIFRICETTGGTQWYIVEYERETTPPLISVERSLAVLQKWGKV